MSSLVMVMVLDRQYVCLKKVIPWNMEEKLYKGERLGMIHSFGGRRTFLIVLNF